MTPCVFDSSTVIAILNKEPGHDMAEKLISQSLISTVNVTEVAKHLSERIDVFAAVQTVLKSLKYQIIAYSNEQAEYAGFLYRTTAKYGLSLGDRACLALAISKNLPVVTTDKIWANIDLPIDVTLLR